MLTVYYTRSGNTERVVKEIHESLGGDIELISEPVSRKGIIGWIKSGSGNSKREVAKIDKTQYDPVDYDLVILASPIWAGAVSSPMRGYIVENREKLERTAVFLSSDSGSVNNAFVEIHELLDNPPLVEGSLQRSKIKTEFESTVNTFIESISSL
jgi:menaquinone-dependent protoporphyrinogen IX oxidase